MKFVTDVKLDKLMKNFYSKLNGKFDSKVDKVITPDEYCKVIKQPVAMHIDRGDHTGIFKITMPKSWCSTMLSFDISCYDYNNGKFTYHVSGYNYSAESRWNNQQISIEGKAVTNQVRFSHDGTHCCILIGNPTTKWSYPKLIVENVLATHASTSGWETGWSIDKITDDSDFTLAYEPTDTTASHDHDSRYLKQDLGPVTDFNTAIKQGIYVVSSGTAIPNAPLNSGLYGELLVLTNNSNELHQIFFEYSGKMYTRFKATSEWLPWATVYTSANKQLLGDESFHIKPQRSNEINFGGAFKENTSIFFGYNQVDGRPLPTDYTFGKDLGTANVRAKEFYASGNKVFHMGNKPTWNDVNGKPSTFTPSAHSHDDRYYTEAEVESKLNNFYTGVRKVAVVRADPNSESGREPLDYTTGLQYEFKKREAINNPHGGGIYTSLLTMKPWEDNTGGVATQIAFSNGDATNGQPKVAIRNNGCADSGWGSWYEMVISGMSTNIDVSPRGDYGFGIAGKPAGFIGSFPGWGEDTLYINTYSDLGLEKPTFNNVKVHGKNFILMGGTLYAPYARDINSIVMNANYGECGIFTGNGDTATFDAQNMYIKSWYGLGFRNNNNETTMLMDLRLGNFEAKGSIVANNLIKTRGKGLVVSWDDPGDIGEGGVWIRS